GDLDLIHHGLARVRRRVDDVAEDDPLEVVRGDETALRGRGTFADHDGAFLRALEVGRVLQVLDGHLGRRRYVVLLPIVADERVLRGARERETADGGKGEA